MLMAPVKKRQTMESTVRLYFVDAAAGIFKDQGRSAPGVNDYVGYDTGQRILLCHICVSVEWTAFCTRSVRSGADNYCEKAKPATSRTVKVARNSSLSPLTTFIWRGCFLN